MNRTCKWCKRVFSDEEISSRRFSCHVKWCKENPDVISRKLACTLSRIFLKKAEKKNGKLVERTFICEKCQQSFTAKVHENRTVRVRFCSRSCANTKVHSKETRKKMSNSMKLFIESYPEKFYAALEKALKHSPCFVSAGEKELLGVLQRKFSQHEFHKGGTIFLDETIKKAIDIVSKKLRLIIEYDGICHFKNVFKNMSLKVARYRDFRLEDWCVANQWKIIRVNERTMSERRDEVLYAIFETIENLHRANSVTKFYWCLPEK